MSPTNFNQIQSTLGTFTETVTFSNVTIYEGANYQGKSVQLSVGKHRLLGQADMNDQISSIKVPPGLVVQVYEHADEGGGYGLWTDLLEDCPDLSPIGMGDKISFLNVFSAETREGFIWIRNAMVNGAFIPGHWERKRATVQPPQGKVPVIGPTLAPHSLPTPPAFASRVIHISDLHCTSSDHTLGANIQW